VSFVARGFSSKPKELAALIEQGAKHHGFSFIHVLSPCPTFYNTMDVWKATVTPISADHDIHDRSRAMELAMETEKPYVGLFFQEERPTMDQTAHQVVQQAQEFDINRYMARYA
jgi:2-oxoglutarate/2-oxoacid ferredoxin oxidoreductase subunit beta